MSWIFTCEEKKEKRSEIHLHCMWRLLNVGASLSCPPYTASACDSAKEKNIYIFTLMSVIFPEFDECIFSNLPSSPSPK
jgi:hypothetical protein